MLSLTKLKHSLEFILINWCSISLSTMVRGCQIGMQGPQLCAKPRHFCKLDVATSRMAFLDLNLHVLQVATPNSNNLGCSVVQNCTSDTPWHKFGIQFAKIQIHYSHQSSTSLTVHAVTFSSQGSFPSAKYRFAHLFFINICFCFFPTGHSFIFSARKKNLFFLLFLNIW